MSEHKNLTKDEVKALMKHGFPAGTPSQLSDSFVFGMRYGKMTGDAVIEENQRLTTIATKHATRADELYGALKEIHDEAVDYQKRTGKKVTWVESVSLLLEKRTASDYNDD